MTSRCCAVRKLDTQIVLLLVLRLHVRAYNVIAKARGQLHAVYIITEYAQGGDLLKLLLRKETPLGWRFRIQIAKEVCSVKFVADHKLEQELFNNHCRVWGGCDGFHALGRFHRSRLQFWTNPSRTCLFLPEQVGSAFTFLGRLRMYPTVQQVGSAFTFLDRLRMYPTVRWSHRTD